MGEYFKDTFSSGVEQDKADRDVILGFIAYVSMRRRPDLWFIGENSKKYFDRKLWEKQKGGK